MPAAKRLRRRAAICPLAALALACAVAPASGWGAPSRPAQGDLSQRLARAAPDGAGAFAPGEAIVRFERGASRGERSAARRSAGVDFEGTLGVPHAQVVEVEGSVRGAVRRLERQPGVAYAQPNFVYEALAVVAPNDSFFGDLWGLSDPASPDPGVGALEAWEGTRGEGQVIAVVDTGVDLSHPDLVGNLWTNEAPGPDADLHGYDFVDEDGDPDDYQFHGTHVAGTAAAEFDNELGIAGVAPEAEIMAVRVLDGDGSGFTADIAAGISYAAEHGAGVINLSLGGPAGEDQATEEAIELAGSEGAVVVAAAGNEGVDNDVDPHSPCVLPQANLICVAALGQSGSLAGFSNYGAESVDIAAPGTSILSAKTDYGAPVFSEGFESGLADWTVETFNGGVPWGASNSAAAGAQSATDSPGGDYGNALVPTEFALSELSTSDPVDLAGERGCRVHFRTRYRIEQNRDGFAAGAFSEVPFDGVERFDELIFDGESAGFPQGSFTREEVSISDLDGRGDVHPEFAILSDEEVTFDGAYVDEVRLICRDETYVDAKATLAEYDQPGAGNYVRFSGTSMATPHVAGVVALVRAAAPGLGVQQVVDAVLDGASAMPDPDAERPTATFGIADACKAIAVATGGDVETDCPASTVPVVPSPDDDEDEDSSPDSDEPNAAPPVAVPPPPVATPDRIRPHTFIQKRPRKVILTPWRRGRAVFRFRSNERGALFFCEFDRKRLRRCGPRFVRWFRVGRHVLRVKARDAAGNVDASPVVYRFRVRRVSKEQFARFNRRAARRQAANGRR